MDAEEDLGPCGCGRRVNKRGKTCCSMCWVGYAGHSRLCQRRHRAAMKMVACEPGSETAKHFVTTRTPSATA